MNSSFGMVTIQPTVKGKGKELLFIIFWGEELFIQRSEALQVEWIRDLHHSFPKLVLNSYTNFEKIQVIYITFSEKMPCCPLNQLAGGDRLEVKMYSTTSDLPTGLGMCLFIRHSLPELVSCQEANLKSHCWNKSSCLFLTNIASSLLHSLSWRVTH